MDQKEEGDGSNNAVIARDVLVNIIVVIERIFKYLTARELNACARVCKVWHDQVVREKNRRPQMLWNSFAVHEADEDDFEFKEWWSNVASWILSSPMEPQCLLVFCSEKLWFSWSGHSSSLKVINKKRRRTKVVTDVFADFLPRSCSYQVVITGGIVGTDNSMKTREMEEYDYAVSIIMFNNGPRSSKDAAAPSIEFVPFSCDLRDCQELSKSWKDAVSTTVPKSLSGLANKKVKMVNLYSHLSGADQEVCSSLSHCLNWPLIAGGYVSETLIRDCSSDFESCNFESLLTGLAICGEDVQVASVLVRSNVDTEQEVDAIVKQLASHNLSLDNTFGLMYACLGRGIHVYEKHNVESSIFRKYFPNIPLLGFFGNGEIGCCYPPYEASALPSFESGDSSDEMPDGHETRAQNRGENKGDKLRALPRFLHSYTTVLCLVSLPSNR